MGLIRKARPEDAGHIAEIYNHYILYSCFTFEKKVIDGVEMSKRIHSNPNLPWLVFDDNGIKAYAYGSTWKKRAAYEKTVEVSIYLKHDCLDRGIGRQLYCDLLERLKLMDKHAIIAGIALPNDRSIQFHKKLGFKKVAHFEEVGYKFEKWVDVAYYQLFL